MNYFKGTAKIFGSPAGTGARKNKPIDNLVDACVQFIPGPHTLKGSAFAWYLEDSLNVARPVKIKPIASGPARFIAEIPELAGAMADGLSYSEAVGNAEIIIREWIETATELGRKIPDPKGRLLFA